MFVKYLSWLLVENSGPVPRPKLDFRHQRSYSRFFVQNQGISVLCDLMQAIPFVCHVLFQSYVSVYHFFLRCG
jgi:hypothetical protein